MLTSVLQFLQASCSSCCKGCLEGSARVFRLGFVVQNILLLAGCSHPQIATSYLSALVHPVILGAASILVYAVFSLPKRRWWVVLHASLHWHHHVM